MLRQLWLHHSTSSFQNIIGIMRTYKNGKTYESYFPLLVFLGYDDGKNIISFSSPYLYKVVTSIYDASLLRDKRGNIKLNNGRKTELASHSYLIKPEIAKERNKAAVENVFIIVKLIEQTGNNTPNIKASTILERNELLKLKLSTDKTPRTIIQRVFIKTWQLLATHKTTRSLLRY